MRRKLMNHLFDEVKPYQHCRGTFFENNRGQHNPTQNKEILW